MSIVRKSFSEGKIRIPNIKDVKDIKSVAHDLGFRSAYQMANMCWRIDHVGELSNYLDSENPRLLPHVKKILDEISKQGGIVHAMDNMSGLVEYTPQASSRLGFRKESTDTYAHINSGDVDKITLVDKSGDRYEINKSSVDRWKQFHNK